MHRFSWGVLQIQGMPVQQWKLCRGVGALVANYKSVLHLLRLCW